VPEVLELTQLAERDSMSEMQVGGRRVDAELHSQPTTAAKLLGQRLDRVDGGSAATDDVELLVDGKHRASLAPPEVLAHVSVWLRNSRVEWSAGRSQAILACA
jgi:hypothetical protein